MWVTILLLVISSYTLGCFLIGMLSLHGLGTAMYGISLANILGGEVQGLLTEALSAMRLACLKRPPCN